MSKSSRYRDRWADWLDQTILARNVLGVPPKGGLAVTRVHPPAKPQARLL